MVQTVCQNAVVAFADKLSCSLILAAECDRGPGTGPGTGTGPRSAGQLCCSDTYRKDKALHVH